MRKWKLSFMASLGYAQESPEAVVDSLAEIGYEAIGWTLAHFNPRTHNPKQLQKLVKATQAAGLEIGEIVVQQDYVTLDDTLRQDRIQLSMECIEAAATLGLPTLNFFTGPAPWDPNAPVIGRDISEGDAWDMVFRTYHRLLRAAEKHQIRIAVEGVWGMLCHDYYTTRHLIDHFQSPLLGVNFDPSHDILAGNLDIPWITQQWGPKRIHHVHLKDAVGKPRMGEFLFPLIGEGLVPWKAFFQALDAIDYQGCCSVEFESFDYHKNVLKGDTAEAARISHRDIMALLGE